MRHAFDPGIAAGFLDGKGGVFVLIAVPRLEGKMNASGLALVAGPRQNSSSVSIEAASQT